MHASLLGAASSLNMSRNSTRSRNILLGGYFSNVAHFFDRGSQISLMEQRSAADKCISTRFRAFGRRFEIDSAINADMVGKILLFSPGARLLDFGQDFVDESLPAKTRMDRHDQQRINLAEKRKGQIDRSRRIDGQANFLSQGFYLPNQMGDPVSEFDVDIHLAGPGFGKWFEQNLRFAAHQVNVEKEFGQWPSHFDDSRPK